MNKSRHTTSRTSTSVAGLEGFLVAALAKVIGTSVGDDGTLFLSAKPIQDNQI